MTTARAGKRLAGLVAALAGASLLYAPSAAAAESCPVCLVKDALEQATDTLGETAATVKDTADGTVDTTTGIVDETVEGTPLEEPTQTTTKLLRETSKGLTETVVTTVERSGKLLNDTVGTLVPDARPTDPEDPRRPDRNPEPDRDPERREPGEAGGPAQGPRSLLREPSPQLLGPGRPPVVSSEPGPYVIPREPFVEQLERAARELGTKIVFPLALAVMVIAFLVIQDRLDRKDPKLASAPVDSEHDYLTFR